MISTSSAVRQTPQMSGSPKSRLRAIAAPSTSARSQAAIAISQTIHRKMRDRAREVIAARLGEIAAAGDAEARGERLQQNRHQVRDHDDAEQRVAEPGAAGEVGGPVAGVHVADGHQVPGPREGHHLFPEAGAVGNRNGSVDLGQADVARGQPPSARGRGRRRAIFRGHTLEFDDSKRRTIIAPVEPICCTHGPTAAGWSG